ncbi:MAG: hypothetical protein EXS32_15865 [Opitutus sp.]|nr:hypothetical protein [Opitutus sp.]
MDVLVTPSPHPASLCFGKFAQTRRQLLNLVSRSSESPSIHSQRSGNTAIHPSTRPDYSNEQQTAWLIRHEELIGCARHGNAPAVFLGDSLTDQWRTVGHGAWARAFASLPAINLGISGDRTQQVLWRLAHGALDGITPRAIVLLIGTNNLDPGLGENSLTPRNSPSEIVAGIVAIVAALRDRSKESHILIHGLLPRGLPDAPVRSQIAEINASLRNLDDGQRLRFIDLSPHLLAPDGSLGSAFMPDLLHLSEEGYELWAHALQDVLCEFIHPHC